MHSFSFCFSYPLSSLSFTHLSPFHLHSASSASSCLCWTTSSVPFIGLGEGYTEKVAHSRSGAVSDGLSQLESLRAVTTLGLAADDINRFVDELGVCFEIGSCPMDLMMVTPIYRMVDGGRCRLFSTRCFQ